MKELVASVGSLVADVCEELAECAPTPSEPELLQHRFVDRLRLELDPILGSLRRFMDGEAGFCQFPELLPMCGSHHA